MSVKLEYDYPEKIVIGTRGSALAMWQANAVKEALAKISQYTDVEIKVIKTSGDWKPEQGEVRLDSLKGGKAQFAKEIEEALLAGQIDIAVHSIKDMETILPEGLQLAYALPRGDARDAFLSGLAGVNTIDDLPLGATVGTASVRRQAFLLNKRPDLKVVPFRGNVDTRLEKLKNGQVDATFLAVAGLQRLGIDSEISSVVDPQDMLPPVGQGAIGLEIRERDSEEMAFISQLTCYRTYLCVKCERAVLRAVSGNCHTPIGVYARLEGDIIILNASVVSPDGKHIYSEHSQMRITTLDDVISMGHDIGERLKLKVPKDILEYSD